jgi:hypothetical protein
MTNAEWPGRLVRLFLLFMLVLPGCMTLDSNLFDPSKVAEYFMAADMDTAWHVRGNVIPDSLREAVTLKSLDSNRIHGFFVRARPDTDGPGQSPTTVLYCHGNGQNINRYWGRVELLWEMGCNVFIFDYQGYGKSEGSPSGAACYADAEAALAYVLGRTDVDTARLAYYGWSLGSFVAMHLATDVRRPAALVLENPLASTSALAREGAVLAIPGSFVATADFDNERRIADGEPETRLFIVYGKLDDTAVPERNALVLLGEARGWKKIDTLAVEGAGHSDIPEKMGCSEYCGTISEFLSGQ